MRYLTVAFLMLFWMNTSRAQKFEVGPYVGGSNFIGDVGATNYINPNSIAFGGIFKWNRSLRHAWRLSIIHTRLEADDRDSEQGRRQQRGYSFSNGLTEINLGLEFNFWDWNIYSSRQQITPYLSTGITGILTHDLYVDDAGDHQEKRNKYGLALPMILGIKGQLGRNLVLAFEIGARMTFSDNIDGSSPSEFDGGDVYPSFGNKNTNDWYMFTGITLTYTFGHNPCFDVY